MLCQHCNHNEADKTFVINWMGTQYMTHICSDCLHQMWQQAGQMGQGEWFRQFAGWWPGKEDAHKSGEPPFPRDAGAEMKLRLRIAALRARLAEAAEQENYEEAARLRDSLAAMEKEGISLEF